MVYEEVLDSLVVKMADKDKAVKAGARDDYDLLSARHPGHLDDIKRKFGDNYKVGVLHIKLLVQVEEQLYNCRIKKSDKGVVLLVDLKKKSAGRCIEAVTVSASPSK